MTDSQRWLEQVSLYIEGRLTGDELAALAAALRADPTLRQTFLEYLNLDAALEDHAAGPDAGQRQHLDLAVMPAPAKPRRRIVLWLSGVAAAATILLAVSLAGWWLGSPKPGHEQMAARLRQTPPPAPRPPTPGPSPIAPPGQPPLVLASCWRIEPIADAEYRLLGQRRLSLKRGQLAVQSAARPEGSQPLPMLTIETSAGTATSQGDWFCIETRSIASTRTSKEPNMNPLIRATRVLVLAGMVTLVNAQGSITGTAYHLLAAEPGKAPIDMGLPKTAIKQLEPVIAKTLQDKNYPAAIKAIAQKIALEGIIQGNHPEEKITRMEAEIGKARRK